MTKEELKSLTALLVGLSGLATAVGSCNQQVQERIKADSKIYTTLADGQKQQATEILEIHHQLDEVRGYLQAVRPPDASPPPPPAAPTATLRPLTPLSRFRLAPLPSAASSAAPPPAPMPPVPSPSPPPVLRPLPRYEDIASP